MHDELYEFKVADFQTLCAATNSDEVLQISQALCPFIIITITM